MFLWLQTKTEGERKKEDGREEWKGREDGGGGEEREREREMRELEHTFVFCQQSFSLSLLAAHCTTDKLLKDTTNIEIKESIKICHTQLTFQILLQ